MNKIILFHNFLFFLCGGYFSQHDTIYVWKKGGVHLIQSPEDDKTIIKTLPFGSMLTILEDTVIRSQFQQEIKLSTPCEGQAPFYLEGNYTKVISDKDTGYIYNGFTCSVPTPEQGYITYHDFFKGYYGKPEVTSMKDSINHMNMWYQFKNGFTINYRSDFGGRKVHYTIVLNGLNANDAFLIVNHFERVNCAKQQSNSIFFGMNKYFQFSTSNENVSEGSAVIIEYNNRVLIEIQQDWD